MSIFDIFNKNKKPAAPGDSFLKEAEKAHKATEKRLAAKEKRQKQIEECAAVLRDCRATFQKSIIVENALAAETRRKGYDPYKQRGRIREAAIGILVTDLALLELQSINSESDLNSAMNKMGMALRQLRHVDNKTAAISTSTERIVEKWYPGAFTQQAQPEDAAAMPVMEVPEEMRAKINDTFVQNLMNGDSYEMAMFKHELEPEMPARPTVSEQPRVDTDKILETIHAAVQQEPSSGENTASVIQQHGMQNF